MGQSLGLCSRMASVSISLYKCHSGITNCRISRSMQFLSASDFPQYSPNSTWLVTTRHVRCVKRVETSVSYVEPCCSNMADDKQTIVLACTSLVVFTLLHTQTLFAQSNEINVYFNKLVNNLTYNFLQITQQTKL